MVRTAILQFGRRHVGRAAHPRNAQPVVECLEDRVLFNINISQLSQPGNQSEGTIALDPTNSNRMFAASNSEWVPRVMARYSVDGGTTWLQSNLSQIPVGLGDPQATFDTYGNLYLTYITHEVPTRVVVAVSYNAGISFLSQDFEYFGEGDRPSIAAGIGGAGISEVQACVSFARLSVGIVASCAPVYGFGLVDSFGALWLAPGSYGGNYGSIAISRGPGYSGQVMVTYALFTGGGNPTSIFVNTAGPLLLLGFRPPVLVSNTNVGYPYIIPPQPTRGIAANPSLAYDVSGLVVGGHGRAYLAYVDAPSPMSTDTNIFLRYSDDVGQTWSAAEQLNDDQGANSQFMPQIAVDQTSANVAIAWSDARNSAGNNTVEIYATVKILGGPRRPNRVVSPGPSDENAAATPNDCGDYNTMTARSNWFYPIWADNSVDAFGNSLLVPPNGPWGNLARTFDMATKRVDFQDFLPGPLAPLIADPALLLAAPTQPVATVTSLINERVSCSSMPLLISEPRQLDWLLSTLTAQFGRTSATASESHSDAGHGWVTGVPGLEEAWFADLAPPIETFAK